MGNNLSKQVVSMKINEKVREELIVNMKTEIASLNRLVKCRGEEIAKSHIDIINMTQEIEELKKGLSKEELDETAKVICNLLDSSKKLKEENEELKKENEEMIAVHNKFKELLHKETSLDDMFIDSLMDKAYGDNEFLSEKEEEIDQLKEKVDTLEQQTEGFRVEYPKLEKEIDQLKDEREVNLLSIKKLKMEKEMLVKLSKDKLNEKREQIEKLKETLTKVDSLVSPVLFG